MTPEFPYHVWARSNNQEWFFLPINRVWNIFLKQLSIVSERYEAQVISFVLMSNHFHLLVRTPLANLDEIMNYFMREASRAIGKEAGRINHVFGGRYKSTLITKSSYLYHAYRYVYQNPVAANLTSIVEVYPYSTLPVLLGTSTVPFALADDLAVRWAPIPQEMEERRVWLNQSYTERERQLIHKGLRRVSFSFSKQATFKADVRRLLDKF